MKFIVQIPSYQNGRSKRLKKISFLMKEIISMNIMQWWRTEEAILLIEYCSPMFIKMNIFEMNEFRWKMIEIWNLMNFAGNFQVSESLNWTTNLSFVFTPCNPKFDYCYFNVQEVHLIEVNDVWARISDLSRKTLVLLFDINCKESNRPSHFDEGAVI